MPYRWTETPIAALDNSGAASFGEHRWRLEVWPYRSMPKRGFVGVIALFCALALVPLLIFMGSVFFWVLLAFMCLVLSGTWWALQKNYNDAELLEVLDIFDNHLMLVRTEPNGKVKDWEANPYWTSLHITPDQGPVQHYLTLKGNNREVELGAYLTPEEREALYSELQLRLR